MTLSQEIIELLRQKSGLQLQASYECQPLIDAIASETNQVLSLSTVKRLLGFFADARTPHQSTLDIIARYLGFSSWNALLSTFSDSEGDFINSSHHVDSASLAEGDVVHVKYYPQRELVLLHKEGPFFVVKSCTSGKLCVGDELVITDFVPGFPLYIKKVTRGGKSLGAYMAARRNGVQKVDVVLVKPE